MLAPPNPRRRERGQGLVEYGMIIILVAIVVLALLTVFGPAVGNMFSNAIETI